MKRFGCLTLVFLAVFIAVFIACVFPWLMEGIDDAYAQWGAAEMVIDYMQANDGKWPLNWEALRPSFECGGGRVGGWSFEMFQSRIYIDFDADADELRALSRRSESVPFNVIHAKSIWASQFDDGPNGILFEYFRTEEGDSSKREAQ